MYWFGLCRGVGFAEHMLCFGETDDEARRIGYRAWEVLKRNVWSVHWYEPRLIHELPTAHYELLARAFESAVATEKVGGLVVGSPDTVRDYFKEYVSEGVIDYLMVGLPYGDMTHEEAMRSLRLFIDDVMPALRAVDAKASLQESFPSQRA
jgi:alkanesulfonate monooxygenase SsuD/methylene tetrahydromethanopterin reductase-like flavin-dependent oxidoreductase (luciferase family)